MKKRYSVGAVLLGVLLLGILFPGSVGWKTVRAESIELSAVGTLPSSVNQPDVFIHVPPGLPDIEPLRILLVLHGMGGQGKAFAEPLIAAADRNHWLLVAPTMPYAVDYLDAAKLTQEDLDLGKYLQTLLEGLPSRLGLRLYQHALILGFSRGAQVAHRFAFFHPELVESVAAISAGSYTMPFAKSNDKILNFPFGVGDLQQRLGVPIDWDYFKQISFWIAVGSKDNRPNDVARAFDPYCGRTRIERAKAFEKALQDMGVDAHLTVFDNADHEVTSEMRNDALQFLRQDELADNVDGWVP